MHAFLHIDAAFRSIVKKAGLLFIEMGKQAYVFGKYEQNVEGVGKARQIVRGFFEC